MIAVFAQQRKKLDCVKKLQNFRKICLFQLAKFCIWMQNLRFFLAKKNAGTGRGMNWESVLVHFLSICELRRMDTYKKNVIEIAQDHILIWNPTSNPRDYKNKEQRKQVWEDIVTNIRTPTGNFSWPVMGCLQLAATGCNGGRTNARSSLYVPYVILV